MNARYPNLTKRSASLACNFVTSGPTTTPTPIPPTATSTPIPPTSTPTPIPGIDEPIILENVRVKDFLGNVWTGDIQLRFLNAYTKDQLENQSGAESPSNPENIFLILDFELDGESGSLEWTSSNATLTCGANAYKVNMFGLEVGDDGKLKAWRLIFEVPQDSEIKQCVFNIKEHIVELDTLFK